MEQQVISALESHGLDAEGHDYTENRIIEAQGAAEVWEPVISLLQGRANRERTLEEMVAVLKYHALSVDSHTFEGRRYIVAQGEASDWESIVDGA